MSIAIEMKQRLQDGLAFWRELIRRSVKDQIFNSAAALTYTTLFAVVPVMTVTFAMLPAIPAFQGADEQIQDFIFGNFVPSTGDTVQQYLREFSAQARQLTWMGVIVLMVTALMMLVTIEKTLNAIWRVRQLRRGISSFLLYWAILSLGPLLLGAGFAITTYVASLSFFADLDTDESVGALLRFAPLLFSAAAFTLIYVAVPNTRVMIRHALVGGVFTAALFEVAKSLFGLYVHFFPSYQLIYGAFASVPLFLLWIYLSWVIVLLGAELVYSLSLPRYWRTQPLPPFLLLLATLRQLYDCQQNGVALPETDKAHRLGQPLSQDQKNEIFAFLESEQLVCRISGGGWVLSRDLHHLPLVELLDRSPWPVPVERDLPAELNEPWYRSLRETLHKLYDEQRRLFSASVADWLSPDEKH